MPEGGKKSGISHGIIGPISVSALVQHRPKWNVDRIPRSSVAGYSRVRSNNCDTSQKFSLGVVKSNRLGYNTTEKFCDISQKFSVERRIMIWKLRGISI